MTLKLLPNFFCRRHRYRAETSISLVRSMGFRLSFRRMKNSWSSIRSSRGDRQKFFAKFRTLPALGEPKSRDGVKLYTEYTDMAAIVHLFLRVKLTIANRIASGHCAAGNSCALSPFWIFFFSSDFPLAFFSVLQMDLHKCPFPVFAGRPKWFVAELSCNF